jgi:hypothetical protein
MPTIPNQPHWCPICGHVISRLYTTVDYTARGYCYSSVALDGTVMAHDDHNEDEIDYNDEADDLVYRCPVCDGVLALEAVLDENPGILDPVVSNEEVARVNPLSQRINDIINNNESEISGLYPTLLANKDQAKYAAITCSKCGHANIFVDGNNMSDENERNRHIIMSVNQANISDEDLECEHCLTVFTGKNCTITKHNS